MKFTERLITTLLALGLITTTADAAMVAVIDTGVYATNELTSYIASNGYDFVNNDTDASDTASYPHGTIVATIILRTATSVEILPIKVLDDTGYGLSEWIDSGIKYAAARPQARVVNLSLGSDTYDPITATTLIQAANANQVLVMAAGNDTLPNPAYPAFLATDLDGTAIVVGATDATGVIAWYSNLAGGAKNVYMVADGTFSGLTGRDLDIWGQSFATSPDGKQNVGTSFAAPRVSGAAAVIIDRAPYLTNRQVVDILLKSADDLGATGVDSIYGWGKLNLAKAVAPLGGTGVPTGSKSSGSSAALGVAALGLGAAAAYALMKNKDVKEALILDGYGRGYTVDMTKLIRVEDQKPELGGLFASLNSRTRFMDIQLPGKQNLQIWYTAPETPLLDPFNALEQREAQDKQRANVALSFSGGSKNGLQYQFDFNRDPRMPYGALALDGLDGVNFLSASTLTTPYLSFGETAHSAQLAYNFDQGLGLKFGVAGTDEDQEFGLRSTGAVLEGSYKISDAATVKLQLGGLKETGSLFGGSSGGAFGVDRTTTAAVGLSGQYKLNASLALVGHFAEGYSRIDDTANSLLRNFSTVRSQAYGLGLIGGNVFKNGDRLGVALSRPLRVTSGGVDMDVPYARDFVGNIYKNRTRLDMQPDGAELDLETYYSFALGKRTRVGTYFMYQNQPYNTKTLKDRVTLFTVISRDF